MLLARVRPLNLLHSPQPGSLQFALSNYKSYWSACNYLDTPMCCTAGLMHNTLSHTVQMVCSWCSGTYSCSGTPMHHPWGYWGAAQPWCSQSALNPPSCELADDFSIQCESLFSKHPTTHFNYFLINSSFSKHLDYWKYNHIIYKSIHPPQ